MNALDVYVCNLGIIGLAGQLYFRGNFHLVLNELSLNKSQSGMLLLVSRQLLV